MDTSARGGMAPALQSTNCKPADLVDVKTTECETTDIGLTNSLKNPAKPDTTVVTLSGNCKFASGNTTASDGIEINKAFSESTSMVVTDTFACTKEPESSQSSPENHFTDENRSTAKSNSWNKHKKPYAGNVLQMKSNLQDVLHNGDDSVIKTNGNEKHLENPQMENNCLKSCPVNHNGKVQIIDDVNTTSMMSHTNNVTEMRANLSELSWSEESKMSLTSKLDSSGINSLSSANVGTQGALISKPANLIDLTARVYLDSEKIGSASGKTKLSQQVTQSYAVVSDNVLFDDISSVSGEESPLSLHQTVRRLPPALKYADLLNGDMSRITQQVPNISQKLANTLQELAASLKGTSLKMDSLNPHSNNLASSMNTTVKSKESENPNRSVKSLNFENSPSSQHDCIAQQNTKKVNEIRMKGAIEHAHLLQKRLSRFNKKLHKLRLRCTASYTNRELSSITSRKSHSKLPVDTDTLAATEPHHSTDKSHMEIEETEEVIFWKKILNKRLSSFVYSKASHTGPADNHQSKTISNSITEIQIKKEADQPTKDSADADKQMYNKILEKVKMNTGIIRKEAEYMWSRCNQDLTDTSSDEEYVDVSGRTASTQYQSKPKERGPQKNFIHRKSFCKWMEERVEIAKRWTWLQSRISDIEFNIRRQGELYRHLRNKKGPVQLNSSLTNQQLKQWKPTTTNTMEDQIFTKSQLSTDTQSTLATSVGGIPTSGSLCNVNQVMSNVQFQTTKMLGNLSPLSVGSPSPAQPKSSKSHSISLDRPSRIGAKDNGQHIYMFNSSEEKSAVSARTQPLLTSTFKKRILMRSLNANRLSDKQLNSVTVPNDSSVMRFESTSRHHSWQRFMNNTSYYNKYQSLAVRAAQHDHCYHAIISMEKDIPVSITTQAVMKSKRKWCKADGYVERKSENRKQKRRSESSRKHRTRKRKYQTEKIKGLRNSSSSSSLPMNSVLNENVDSKRRKFDSQNSYTSERKRHRGLSFDSDIEMSLVIGTVPNQQLSRGANSGANTPTSELLGQQSQSYWKKKKSSEQAYDINNIVIPHGLTSMRIEKLPYKEIQTPSWKYIEEDILLQLHTSSEIPTTKDGEMDETETTSDLEYQQRHDRYEILEKKKYMAYMEWSLSRKGRTSRLSNSSGGLVEPTSPASAGGTTNATTVAGSTAQIAEIDCNVKLSPVSTSTCVPVIAQNVTSPTDPGVRTRRMSAESEVSKTGTSLPHSTITNTSNTNSCSVHFPQWQEGLGSRLGSQENTTSRHSSTLSCRQNSHSGTWEARPFPLCEEDMKLLNDVDYAFKKLQDDYFSKLQNTENSGVLENSFHFDSEEEFRSKRWIVSRQPSNESMKARSSYSSEHFKSETTNQHFKSGNHKRHWTDSRSSFMFSHEDIGRFSDASNASASSVARRKRKKASSYRKRSGSQSSQHKKDSVSGKIKFHGGHSSTSAHSRHKFMQLRLSETDDSMESESDFSHSSDESTTSIDDAGHQLDDEADPEWGVHYMKFDR